MPIRFSTASSNGPLSSLGRFFGVFRYSRRAIDIVWSTSRGLTSPLAVLTLIAGVLPAAAAYVGQLIVDGVVAAIDQTSRGQAGNAREVLMFVGLAALIVTALTASARGLSL